MIFKQFQGSSWLLQKILSESLIKWFKEKIVRLHFVDSAIPGIANDSCRCKLGCKIPARVGKKNKLTIEVTKIVNSIGWRSQGWKVVPAKSWFIKKFLKSNLILPTEKFQQDLKERINQSSNKPRLQILLKRIRMINLFEPKKLGCKIPARFERLCQSV